MDASTKFRVEIRSCQHKRCKRCIPPNVGLAFLHIIPDNRKPHLSMEYEIRPLLAKDEPILREMLYQGLSSVGNHQPSREILQLSLIHISEPTRLLSISYAV